MAIEYADFDRVDMRTGLVLAVEEFPRARTPSYKVQVDFGPEVGVKWSSAQAKRDYQADELLGWELQVGTAELGYYTMCEVGGKLVAGISGEPAPEGVPNAWTTYFAVD